MHFGLVREESHDLVLAGGVENIVQVAFHALQRDVAVDILARFEYLRGIIQQQCQVAAQFRSAVSDVGFAGKLQNPVGRLVRVEHPVVAQSPGFVAEHLHPDITQRHVAVEVLQIEPVGLRRLFGTLQVEA